MAVIQSFMGRPKIHKPKDPVAVVDDLFPDVVITIFELMCRYESFWKEVKWSRPTAVFGFGMGELESTSSSGGRHKRSVDQIR